MNIGFGVEYKMICDFYGVDTAKRSGVKLINHINEGLIILEHYKANSIAKGAYCVHPIFQSDIAIFNNWQKCYNVSSGILLAVMEYRSVANEYLSKRKITSIDEIRLSPINDVNLMLIADKVQNYKDFEIYHKGTHERSEELDEYFNNWLRRLGVSPEKYIELKNIINSTT